MPRGTSVLLLGRFTHLGYSLYPPSQCPHKYPTTLTVQATVRKRPARLPRQITCIPSLPRGRWTRMTLTRQQSRLCIQLGPTRWLISNPETIRITRNRFGITLRTRRAQMNMVTGTYKRHECGWRWAQLVLLIYTCLVDTKSNNSTEYYDQEVEGHRPHTSRAVQHPHLGHAGDCRRLRAGIR